MSISIPQAFKSKISIPFGKLKDVISWVDKNCVGEVKYMEDPDDQYNSWIFFFEQEKDFVAFTLWLK
jgi:hypothetical protein